MENTTLSESFESLKDPRLERAKRHSLINIITIAICAVICGADNFVSMASFGRAKKEWFNTFLDLPNGIPSHDTFNDVINRLDQSSFALCFTTWIKQLATQSENVIAIDGKCYEEHSINQVVLKLFGLLMLGQLQTTYALGKFKLTKNQMK